MSRRGREGSEGAVINGSPGYADWARGKAGGQDEKLINSNFLRPLSTFLHSLQKCTSIPRKRQLDLTYWLGKLGPLGKVRLALVAWANILSEELYWEDLS